MDSENSDAVPRVVPVGRPRPRITRSRLARPLLTSLGTVTLLAASSFVLLAVSSTGSARPWDWTRADPTAAVSRYRLCGHQGVGTVGCMLGAAFRPASAAGNSAGHRAQQPLLSVATVQDPAPADARGSAQGARTASRGSTGTARPSPGAPGVGRLVGLEPGASLDDVLEACQAGMKTASTQGSAAMSQVEAECQAALASRCPSLTTPQVQGMAAILALEQQCRPVPQPSASPGHDD